MAAEFVLDADVAIAWFIPGSPEQRDYAGWVARHIETTGASCVVPALWHFEVGAVLIRARRAPQIRFSEAKLRAAMDRLRRLSPETRLSTQTAAEVIERARACNLQGYDVAYFDLARDLELPIATLDGGIRTACRRFGVKLLQP